MRLFFRGVTLILALSSTAYAAFLPFTPRAFSDYFNQVLTNNGTSQFLFNSWAANYWDLSSGTSGQPVAGTGPLLKVSKTEQINSTSCNSNNVDNECNATAAFYNVGTSSDGMQTNAIFAGAKGTASSDNVGLSSIGLIYGTGTGIGTGAYLEGRRDTSTGGDIGAEVRSNNVTSSAESYTSAGFNNGGLWVTASGQAKSACGACVGNAGQNFDVGFGLTVSSVVSQAFRDDSSAVTSIKINGSHTNGIDLTGGTYSGDAIVATGFNVDASGNVTGNAYKVGATAGVSCSGTPTASFAVTNGIVTHC